MSEGPGDSSAWDGIVWENRTGELCRNVKSVTDTYPSYSRTETYECTSFYEHTRDTLEQYTEGVRENLSGNMPKPVYTVTKATVEEKTKEGNGDWTTYVRPASVLSGTFQGAQMNEWLGAVEMSGMFRPQFTGHDEDEALMYDAHVKEAKLYLGYLFHYEPIADEYYGGTSFQKVAEFQLNNLKDQVDSGATTLCVLDQVTLQALETAFLEAGGQKPTPVPPQIVIPPSPGSSAPPSGEYDPSWPDERKNAFFKRYAMEAQAKSGVPWQVAIAQFAHESGWGTLMPAGSDNPFDIMADNETDPNKFVLVETRGGSGTVVTPATPRALTTSRRPLCTFSKSSPVGNHFGARRSLTEPPERATSVRTSCRTL